MKKITLLAFFLCLIAFTACSKDDNDGAPTPPPIDNPEPPVPDPESTEGNLDGWNWDDENSDKGLIEAVQ